MCGRVCHFAQFEPMKTAQGGKMCDDLFKLHADVAALAFESAALRLNVIFAKSYNANQPRVPSGQSGGGQWASGGGGESPNIQLAGGFEKEDLTKTVGEFVAAKCLGSIHSEIPGQFYDITIVELLALGKTGDAAAKKCYKILNQNRFRK